MHLRGSSASGISARVLLAAAAGVSVMTVTACGSSTDGSSGGSDPRALIAEPATVPPSDSYYKNDNDRPDGDGMDGDDQRLLAEYGTRPTAAGYDEIATVVKRYLSLALAENGTAACPMLYSGFRNALLELHPSRATSRQPAANACPPLMTREFRGRHSQLTSYHLSTLVVADVSVKDRFGIAVLGFKDAPEREILVAREGSRWKIDSIVDSELT